MQRLLALVTLSLASCGSPSWPKDQFPPITEVERVLFAQDEGSFREGCVAIVVELTGKSATQLMGTLERAEGKLVVVPPDGWSSSPAPGPAGGRNYFEGAFGGCNQEGEIPLGDLDGALNRPGAFYKIINGREGIAIIVPKAKLAGFFYSG